MIEQLLNMNNGKKIDFIMMNPQYNRDLHLKFLEKTIEIADNVINISPHDWLTNKFAKTEKSKFRRYFREKYSKYIEDLEIISPEDFNRYFGTSNWFGVAIGVFKENAKGIDPDKFLNNDTLLNKIINKIHTLPSLRSKFTTRIDNELFVPVRITSHGYLNYVERDYSKIKSKGGILFNSENEVKNFIDSFDTWLYKYLEKSEWQGSENSASVPYLGDYTKPWTNERLYRLFNITKEEQKIIEDMI